jgi:NAD(P)-dependent dehydrogenase (short-subunit alcohol dehydrogenase family)
MSQKILITGSSSGFGKLIAITLLKNGHTVVASMRSADTKNKAAADELKAAGAHIVEIDVTDDNSVSRGVEQAIKLAGGLDVVVNNAGVGVLGFQEMFTPDDWKKLFEINVFGVQRVNRAAIPTMREQSAGLLIHISSLLGRMILPFLGPYNSSKFALEALSDNYRVELSKFGIESVIVEPGGFGTGFDRNLMTPSDTGRESGYGEFAGAPAGLMEGFAKNFEGEGAPDPQWVADAVAKLVDIPKGHRPVRTVVDGLGMGDPIVGYNQALDEITAGVFNAFGLGEMLKVSG